MNCSEVRRLQPQYLALELTAAAEAEVRGHLAACAACRESLVAFEPALVFALTPSAPTEPADDLAPAVLAGIHQRRFERRVARRRTRWMLAAAAALVVTVSGIVAVRHGGGPAVPVAAIQAAPAAAATEPAFVEVEGDGVRVYEMAGGQSAPVQVAFIVNPRMEF